MICLGLIFFSEYDYLIGKKWVMFYEYVSYLLLVEMDMVYYGIFFKE